MTWFGKTRTAQGGEGGTEGNIPDRNSLFQMQKPNTNHRRQRKTSSRLTPCVWRSWVSQVVLSPRFLPPPEGVEMLITPFMKRGEMTGEQRYLVPLAELAFFSWASRDDLSHWTFDLRKSPNSVSVLRVRLAVLHPATCRIGDNSLPFIASWTVIAKPCQQWLSYGAYSSAGQVPHSVLS